MAFVPLLAERTSFVDDRPVCSFANGYDINTLRMSSSYTTFCGQTKRVFRVRVCSTSTTVSSGNGVVLMLSVNVGISVWAGIVGDIAMGPYRLPDRLTDQRCRNILQTVLPGLLEGVPLAMRQRL
jgi:hypothetical protein